MNYAIQSGPKPPPLWRLKYPQLLTMDRGQWFLIPTENKAESIRVQKRICRLCRFHGVERGRKLRFTTSTTAEGVVVERIK